MMFLEDLVGPLREVGGYHFDSQFVRFDKILVIFFVKVRRQGVIKPNCYDFSVSFHLVNQILSHEVDLHVRAAAFIILHFVNIARQLSVIIEALKVHCVDLSCSLRCKSLVSFYRGVVEALNETVFMQTSLMDYFLKDLN